MIQVMESKIDYIQQRISKFSDEKTFMIFQSLIQKYSIQHSENTNGIFLNLSLLTKEIIDDIYATLSSSPIDEVSYKEINKHDCPKVVIKNTSKGKPVKETLALSKFDIRLLELSKQRLPI